MTRQRPVLTGLLLALVVSAPVSAVVPGGAAQQSMTGTLEMVYQDGMDRGPDAETWVLRSGHRITPLRPGTQDPSRWAGRRVTVTGTLAAETLGTTSIAAADGTSGTPAAAAPEATAPVDASAATPVAKSIAVVMFNFSDLRQTPYTAAEVQAAMTGAGGVKAFYEEESKGAVTISARVFGWYQISATTTGCNWSSWETLAWTAANAAGANLSSYTNVMYLFPNTSACGWAGLGWTPGQYTYINGTTSVQVLTHELGHNFGISHANADQCYVNSIRVAIAATNQCSTDTYADPFSTMGNNALRHNHGSHLGELGWLAADQKVVGLPGYTYTITPWLGADGVKLVRIPRGDGTYFDLDYRSSSGVFDAFGASAPAVNGVTIRIGQGTASPGYNPKMTLLIDTTPATSTLADAPLLVSHSVTDPVSTITITALALTDTGISVRVTEAIAPTAPGNMAGQGVLGTGAVLSWTAASDNVAVAGYRVARDGQVIAALDAATLGYTDATAVPGASYVYTVTAVDTSSNPGQAAGATVVMPDDPNATPTPTPDPNATPTPTPSPSSDPPGGLVDVTPPSMPGDLAAVTGTTSVALSWTASTDDIAVAGYRISRDGAVLTTVSGLQWTDTGRAPEGIYTYSVEALDGVGQASDPATIAVMTDPDTAAPTKPLGFRKIARSGIYITFDWADARDNVKVVKYYVYRVGRSSPIAITRVSQIRIATTRGAYYYVRAVDAAGNRSVMSGRVLGRS